MAKRDDMKRRLKAAARRRQRRDASSPPHTARPSTKPQGVEGSDSSSDGSHGVDRIAQTILEHSDEMGPRARDSVILVALRSVLRGKSPECVDAQALAAKLREIPADQQLPEKSFRDGMKEVLAMAESSRNADQSTAFLQYLSLLSN